MRKFLLILSTMIMFFALSFAVGCAPKQNEPISNATLVDFFDETISVEYGSLYTVESYVYDTNGERYTLTVKITDSDGNALDVKDNFIVSAESYYLTYTTKFGGENKGKSVTINAYAKPLIEMEKLERTFALGILPYTIPNITITDPLDDTVTYTKEIFYINSKGQKEKTSYNGADETWMPDKLGSYTLKIVATNKQGISNEEEVNFYVKTPIFGFQPDTDTAGWFRSGSKKAEYVENSKLPTTYVDAEGVTQNIDNSVGFKGDAAYMSVANDYRLVVDMGLSATEYESMAKEYSSVTFSYLIVGTVSFTNADGKTDENGNLVYNGLFSRAGASVAKNQWHTVTIPFMEFVAAMRVYDIDENTLFVMHNWQPGETVDFYFSGITLNKPTASFVPTASNANTLSANTKKGVYVASAALPTTYVDADGVTQNIENTIQYTGNAVRVSIKNDNNLYVAMDYTASEYQAMKDKYESVTFTYLVVGTVSFTGRYGTERSEGSLFYLANADLSKNEWHTVTVSFEHFLTAMQAKNATDDAGNVIDDNTLFLFNTWVNGSATLDFYLGGIELIEKE